MKPEIKYKKGDSFNTLRGEAYIVATQTEHHIINGSYQFLNDGDKLFPAKSKDYVVAFRNPDKNSTLSYIYEDLTHKDLLNLLVR